MKKLLALSLAILMVLSLVACGETKPTEEATKATEAETTTEAQTTEAAVTWPTKTVTIVVPAKAGGAFDTTYRALADAITRKTGVSVIVDNQPDGSGTVGYEKVRNAKPDGTTLLGYSMIINCAHYYGTYEYSPVDDFTGIGETFGKNDRCLVVSANSKWQTFDDFVADAKANPETITCGYTIGGVVHYAIGALMNAGDFKLRLVDAASETDKITAILGGYMDCSLVLGGTAKQYVESGDMRVLAVCASERNAKFPDLPTLTEMGYKTFSWDESYTMLAPKGMDENLKEAIRTTLADIFANDPELKTQINNAGFELVGNFTDDRMVVLDTACKDVATGLGFIK